MTQIIPKIPMSLLEALQKGMVIPFIGAGISRSVEKRNKDETLPAESLFPSWPEFLLRAAEKLDKENKGAKASIVRSLLDDSPPDYLEAAQRAYDGLGQKGWYDLLTDNFEIDLDLASNASLNLARNIWKLGSGLVLTTNIDLVLQSVHEKSQPVRILDTQSPEFAEIQQDWHPARATVLHLHGHIDNKADLVFTKTQYEEFYSFNKNRAKLETLRSLFTQRTMLFIGFSMDDLFILRELERVNVIYEGGGNSFFALLRESEKNNSNVPSYVEKITFSDFGKPLEELVGELSRIAEATGHTRVEDPQNETSNPERMEKDRLKTHFNVPFASKGSGFVGRIGKVDEIWETLNEGNRAAIGQVVIEGFGGLGKTQLAVEYAHKYRDKYENGVFWLTADEDMVVQLIKIGERLNWISNSDTGFDQAELIRNRFRKLSDCLIIFDNVDDQALIGDYLPDVNYHPHILVTSREEQHGFRPINLDTLNGGESRELLIQIARRSPNTEAEERALGNILKELDGLPLAVELVGGYLLRRKNTSFHDYFEYLENEPIDRIEKKLPNNPFTKRDKSIIRALTISERLLNETAYLEEILDTLAWSGKSPMGSELLRDLVATDDNFAFNDAIGVALELHFIKQEENVKRFAIHRLLAKVRQFERPLEGRTEWHKRIVSALENWFRNREEESRTLLFAELELDHLETWQRRTLEYIPGDGVWLTLLKSYPLLERGIYKEAQKITQETLELFQKENLTDNILLANIYATLSRTVDALGNPREAKTFIEKAIDLLKGESIGDEKLMSDLVGALGGIHRSLGNPQKALELQQKALEMERKLLGEAHPNIAASLGNIGGTYSDLGNPHKALELHGQALEMERQLFGEKHPSIAVSLGNLGGTYGNLGDPHKALELHDRALEMARELYGEKHPNIASILGNLGGAYGELGNFQKGLELEQNALEMRRELFGETHPDVANSLSNLGGTYCDLGNLKRGLELHLQSLEMREELFGEKHPEVANSLINLGSDYLDLDHPQKAREVLLQAFEIEKGLFGEKHPTIATILGSLGRVYRDLGNPQKALELNQQVLEMRRQLFGEKHPAIATALGNLGGAYGSTGNFQKALELNGQALDMLRELFGEQHPDIASTLDSIGYTYYYLENKEMALEFHQAALNMRRELLGDKHPQTIKNCYNFIFVLRKMGKGEVAGRLAGEFLSHVPLDHPRRRFFEKHGSSYRQAQRRRKKRRK